MEGLLQLLQYYRVTILVVLLLLYSIWQYFRGRRVNLELARSYLEELEPIIKKHYTNYDGKIIQETANVLKVYALGRKSQYFTILGFALVARQQILAHLLNDLLFRNKDELVIEIPIASANRPIFAMAVLRRTYTKNITKKKYPDLKTLCREYQTALPPSLMVIAESKEFLNVVLNDKIVQLWSSNHAMLKLFYMSDINKFSQYPYSVRMVLELKQKNAQALGDMLEGLILLVDRLSLVRMSDRSKENALQKRQEILNCYEEPEK